MDVLSFVRLVARLRSGLFFDVMDLPTWVSLITNLLKETGCSNGSLGSGFVEASLPRLCRY